MNMSLEQQLQYRTKMLHYYRQNLPLAEAMAAADYRLRQKHQSNSSRLPDPELRLRAAKIERAGSGWAFENSLPKLRDELGSWAEETALLEKQKADLQQAYERLSHFIC